METIIHCITEDNLYTKECQKAIESAGEVLKQGGLVAFPTETVYGLGGDALNAESSRKIYAAKGRPSDNPLIVHICRWEDVYQIASRVPESAKKLAEAFWPGPLTMVLPKAQTVPSETTGGLETVAIRMPSDKVAAALISAAGGFVAAPSANTSGRPSPTVAKYVQEDLSGKIEMIIDGGAACIGLESTIVDLTEKVPMILRPGYITKEDLERVLGTVEVDKAILSDTCKTPPKAPGMKYRHYAPKAPLTIYQGEEERVQQIISEKVAEAKKEGKRVGIITTEENASVYDGDVIKCAGTKADEATVARALYRILREFDEEAVDVIFSEAFAEGGVGVAIMNRLLKAAGHHIEEV